LIQGRALKVVFEHSFRLIFRGKRTVLIALVGFIPLMIAIIWRIMQSLHLNPLPIALPGINMFELLTASAFLHFYVLIFTLFYGTSLFGDEVDNRTLVYILMKPVSRMTLVLGKFLTYLVSGLFLIFPYVLIIYLILVSTDGIGAVQENLNLLFVYSLVLFMALLTYGALFTFLGALTKFAIFIGIGLCFIWEQILVFIPASLKKLTIAYYLQCLFPESASENPALKVFAGTTAPLNAFLVLFFITLISLSLTVWTLKNKEYKFK